MIREEIKQKIIESGQSYAQFSKKLGMAASNFNAWINGARTLPYSTFIKMLNLLNLSVGSKAVGFSYIPADDMPEILYMQMKSTGIKICDISRQTGVDPSVLSAFLTGARRMSTNNVEKVMAVLGLGIVRCTSSVKETVQGMNSSHKSLQQIQL